MEKKLQIMRILSMREREREGVNEKGNKNENDKIKEKN